MAKQKSKQEKQERIKVASQALFSEHGYNGTSSEMIISRAEVSKGLLFFQFQNKEQLLKTCQYEWMEKLNNAQKIASKISSNITQKQLAEKVGTKKSYIYRLENGKCDIQLNSKFWQ
jgi:AcrR family transcriptional regulator